MCMAPSLTQSPSGLAYERGLHGDAATLVGGWFGVIAAGDAPYQTFDELIE